jgi:hypothetical protein
MNVCSSMSHSKQSLGRDLALEQDLTHPPGLVLLFFVRSYSLVFFNPIGLLVRSMDFSLRDGEQMWSVGIPTTVER